MEDNIIELLLSIIVFICFAYFVGYLLGTTKEGPKYIIEENASKSGVGCAVFAVGLIAIIIIIGVFIIFIKTFLF